MTKTMLLQKAQTARALRPAATSILTLSVFLLVGVTVIATATALAWQVQ